MIKEKHDKAPDASSTAVKEEPTNSDNTLNKSLENSETRIKTDEDTATSSCSGGVNKECGRTLTKNGANNVIGSTNTGSLHNLVDQKDPHLLENATDDAGTIQDDATLLGLKTEEGLEPKLPQDALGNMGMAPGVPGSGAAPPHPPPPDGVQPLASNVINKQSSSMEVQYMQQQSQIFVFSTLLANRGADAVLQGQFPSIIAYHCAQPSTKKYLEKNPLKITQFNRHNPAQWLNNLAMMKNKGCTRGPGGVMGKGPANIDGFLGSDGLDDMVGLSDADMPWEQKPNPHLTSGLDGISNGGPMLPNEVDSPCLMRSSPGAAGPPMSVGHSPIMTNASAASPSLASMQPSLQGVKVPDENLTPQQRQHREEQLATIRKMQQMLFPEHQGMIPGENPPDGQDGAQPGPGSGGPPGPCSGGGGPQSGPGSVGPPTSVTGPGPTSGPGPGACSGPGSGPGPMDGMPPSGEMCNEGPQGTGPAGPGGMGPMGPGGGMMPQRPMNMMQGNPGQPSMSPGMNAQFEWQKLRHQYSEERKMGPGGGPVGPMGPGGPPGRNNAPVIPRGGGAGSGPRLQGPPPPYHPTPRSASVPIALQSPNPASPNNPTSNLSLPSPRASSALNSPADPGRSFSLNRHLSTGQSPTSQDSPSTSRGLIPSNPGTPISSHLSPNSNLNVSTAQDFPPISGPTTTSSHLSSDGMFGRSLQSLAQQKQAMCTSTNSSSVPVNKEPNLMPVPSPQQIQYLNTFEGQELTIQKQPNTSLKDGNIISPSMISNSLDGNFSGMNNNNDMCSRLSGPNTPMTPTSMDMGPRFPATPNVSSDGCRYQISSPQTSTISTVTDKGQRVVGGSCLSPQGARTPGSQEMMKNEMNQQYPNSSPHGVMDVHRFSGPGSGGSGCPTTSPGPFPLQQPPQQQQPPPGGNKMQNFMNISPSNKGPGMDHPGAPNYGCVRSDNVPLNPNSTAGIPGNPKVSHFDPISSLAQMSQQLTNSVASSLNGQGGQGGGMMGFNSSAMHMMDPMGGCHGIPDLDSGPSSCGMMGMPPMQGPPHPHPGYHPNPTGNSPLGPVRSLSPKMPNPGGPGGPGGPFPGSMPGAMPGSMPGSMPIPRMMGRGPVPGCNPYNGANVQVKPNAPNTIQYLPAKPQMGNQNPRAPPSLDFLHRFANPLSNLDSKMPTQNLQYFPNCGPNQGPMGGNVPPMGHMDGGHMGPDGPMGGMMNGPMGNGAMNNGPMMGGGMGMGGNMMGQPPGMGMNMPMMRGPGGLRPMGMIRMPQMGFNGPGGGNGGPPNDAMFPNPNMPNPNAQMFVAGPKSSPMGMGAPDASQPLPPSMGQGNTFKNSQFIGPTTADPNYAQQFHNFQQQLYATTTRSQMSNQAMGPGPGPGPPHIQNQPYFVPK